MRQRSIELIEQAKQAEAVGLQALWISVHFHPWNDEQGQSPFVWEVIGAPSEVTSLHIATAVICPTMRIHPAVIAQAAATAAVQRGGRFVLGVGSGEALNEHIFGDPWPWVGARLDILEEAVVISALHRAARSATAAVTTPCRTPASTPVPRSPYPFMCRGSLRRPPSWPAGSAMATAWPCPTPTWSAHSAPPAADTSRSRRG